MQKYYSQKKLENKEINQRDLVVIFCVGIFSLGAFFSNLNINRHKSIKVIESYYKGKFYKVPSKKERFSNQKYDIAISFLPLKDSIRDLKYKLADLNKSIGSYKSDIVKHKAMNQIILMLKDIKKGKVEEVDISKLQQAVLEAGYGNVKAELLKQAVQDYKKQVAEKRSLALKIEVEKNKVKDKIEHDAKETGTFAMGIAREVAEDEIEGFIDKLSLIARVGSFVVNKVSE